MHALFLQHCMTMQYAFSALKRMQFWQKRMHVLAFSHDEEPTAPDYLAPNSRYTASIDFRTAGGCARPLRGRSLCLPGDTRR